MEPNSDQQSFLGAMARRATIWGSLIAALLGLLASFNAMMVNEYVGSGVCLIATALSLGVLAYTSKR